MTNQYLLNAWRQPEALTSSDEVYNLKWLRSAAHIRYDKPTLWFKLGDTGTGKSAEQEKVGEAYAVRRAKILDLQSAHDNEGLAWLRAPCMFDKRILLLTGERTRIEFSQKRYEQKKITEVTLEDVESYDAIINVFAFYESSDEYFELMKPFLQMLYEKRQSWTSVVYTIIREAADLLYSRNKLYEATKDAKNQLIFILRQARHSGLSLSVDTLRFKSLEIDIRRPSSYISIRAQGLEELPDSLSWLYYNFADPNWISTMKPNELLILCKENAAIGRGFVKYPNWHKTEEERILDIFGLKPITNYSAPSFEDKKTDTYDPERDARHKRIVEMYEDQQLSEQKLATELGFQSKTPVHAVLSEHEVKIGFSGKCEICERAGGKYLIKSVKRTRSDAAKIAMENDLV